MWLNVPYYSPLYKLREANGSVIFVIEYVWKWNKTSLLKVLPRCHQSWEVCSLPMLFSQVLLQLNDWPVQGMHKKYSCIVNLIYGTGFDCWELRNMQHVNLLLHVSYILSHCIMHLKSLSSQRVLDHRRHIWKTKQSVTMLKGRQVKAAERSSTRSTHYYLKWDLLGVYCSLIYI